jgi:hypothetical protein
LQVVVAAVLAVLGLPEAVVQAGMCHSRPSLSRPARFLLLWALEGTVLHLALRAATVPRPRFTATRRAAAAAAEPRMSTWQSEMGVRAGQAVVRALA